MAVQIQLRRDLAASWTAANPVLAQGEIGLELDTGKAKAGDGSTSWASLAYLIDSGAAVTVDTDGTLAADSDTRVASQKATKTYADTGDAARLRGLTRTTVKTANYALEANESAPFDCTSASLTATLPTAPADGTVAHAAMQTTASGHTVTVTCGGSDLLDSGAASILLRAARQSVLLVYRSSTTLWEVLAYTVAEQLAAVATSGAYADLSGTPSLGTASALASDTDGTLAANSDARVATQKAVKTYVDASVTGLLDFKGSTDCSANPNYPAASKGDSYVVTVAGKIGGASGVAVDVGDVFVASADNAGGTQAAVGASWFVLEHNLTGALLSANNLSDVASAATARTNLGLGTAATQASTAFDAAGAAAAVTASLAPGTVGTYYALGDANATIPSGTAVLVLTASLTAPRIYTLPAASAYAAGASILFADALGSITTTNTATFARAGGDTIDGGTSYVVTAGYAQAVLVSDGVSRWTARGAREGIAVAYGGTSDDGYVPVWDGATGLKLKRDTVTPTLRSSSATAATLGSELVVDASWALGAGWASLGGGQYQMSVGAAPGTLSQSISVTSGTAYLLAFTVQHSAANNASLQFAIGAATAPLVSYGDTSSYNVQLVIVATATGSLSLAVSESGAYTSGTVTVRALSCKAITQIAGQMAVRRSDGSLDIVVSAGNNQCRGGGGVCLTTGSYNIASGGYAQRSLTAGSYNIASGGYAQRSLTTGNSNIASGVNAQYSLTTGNSNIASGYNAGRYAGATGTTPLTTATSCLYQGANTRASADGVTNETAIGDSAVGDGSNTFTAGNTSVKRFRTYGYICGMKATVATLNAIAAPQEGAVAYATDGRKVGEGAGAGTGVPVYYSASAWLVYSTDAAVAA